MDWEVEEDAKLAIAEERREGRWKWRLGGRFDYSKVEHAILG